jgi:hypothetical protein
VTTPIEADEQTASGRRAPAVAGSPTASTRHTNGSPVGHRAHSWGSAIGFAVCAALGVGLALTIGQDANGDQLYSHTVNVWAALHPHQDLGLMGTLIPALWDVPWYLIAERAPAWVTISYLGVLHSIAWFLSGRIAWVLLVDVRHRWRVTLSVFSVGFAIVAPATLSEFATTFGDLPTSILVLSSVLVVIGSPSPGRLGRRRAFLAGGLLGLAVGLKLTNAPFLVAAAGALVLACAPAWRLRLKSLLYFGLGSGLGAAVTGGYLWVRYWDRFHNPIYPFYNGVFGSPYLDGSPVRDVRFLAKTPFDQVTLPWRMVTTSGYPSELPGRDFRWAILASLALLVAFDALRRRVRRRRSTGAVTSRPDIRFFGWFTLLSWVTWSLQFGAPRYFISIELLSGVAIVLLLKAVVASPLRVTIATLAILGATALGMVVPAYPATPIAEKTWYSFSGGSLTRQPGTLLVMPTNVSLNYTITAFPDDATIVELWQFLGPENDRAALRTDEVMAALRKHAGPVVAVMLPSGRALAARRAAAAGFRQETDCQELRSNYYSPLLCRWIPDSTQQLLQRPH